MQAVLDKGRQLHGSFGTASARAVGNADKVGGKLCKLRQNILGIFKFLFLLGGNTSKGKRLLSGIKKLSYHGSCSS